MTRKQIESATWEWKNYLGLQNWDIIIVWKKSKSKHADGDFKAIAKAVSNPQYKLATIYYDPKQRTEIDMGVIVHELLHCLMSPLIVAAYEHNDPKIEYFNEQITSEVERVVKRLMNSIKKGK